MLRERSSSDPATFIEPCLPRPAKRPPAGRGWLHEIKHDGFRIMARRADGRVRLLTRKGNNFASRFPQIVAAVTLLPVQSCVIDGEAVVCDENGLAVFDLIRRYRHDAAAVLCAFDLIELDDEITEDEAIAILRDTGLDAEIPSVREWFAWERSQKRPQ